jgi:hypothetical protein
MATTTPNFGWSVPTSTDLVKDGATAIETLGDSIDASLLDLKGGTSGQVLAKNSATDMDFVWVTTDDTNAIQNAIVDAKGDLIGATAADTPARLAVGANGTVLTADSAEATGLKWATPTAGGMTLLSTTTLSGSSTAVSSIPGGYINLYCEIINFLPATDDARIYVRPNNVSTANTYYNTDSAAASGNLVLNDTTFTLSLGNDNVTASNLTQFTLFNYDSTATWKMIAAQSMNNAATNPTTTVSYRSLIGFMASTSAITSLTFHLSAGNFTSGTVLLYGVK